MRVPDIVHKILHHRAFVPAGIGVGAVSAGLGVGYVVGSKITERRMLAIFAQVMAEEVTEEEPHDPNQLEIDFRVVDPVEVPNHEHLPPHLQGMEEEVKVLEVQGIDEVRKVLEVRPDITPATAPRTNVFRSASEWDQDREEAQRSDTAAYIISKDEFFEHQREEDNYIQEDLVYYAGDDILTDSADVPQYDHNRMVGELRFGHGSGEENVVYVRNPMLKMEYAITRDHGFYEHEVLGDEAIKAAERDLE
jgi:hypothetical protein